MRKEINKYLNLSIVMSILFAIVGIILMIFPEHSLETISYVIASFLLIYGIFNFVDSFTVNPIFFFTKMFGGILSALLGIIMFLNPNILKTLVPITLGIFFIINGCFKTRLSFIIKETGSYFVLSLIASIITIVCGILLIINPSSTAIVLTTMIGIIITIYAIIDIIDTFVLKKEVKEIGNFFESLLK